jgi:hypothetical protein
MVYSALPILNEWILPMKILSSSFNSLNLSLILMIGLLVPPPHHKVPFNNMLPLFINILSLKN